MVLFVGELWPKWRYQPKISIISQIDNLSLLTCQYAWSTEMTSCRYWSPFRENYTLDYQLVIGEPFVVKNSSPFYISNLNILETKCHRQSTRNNNSSCKFPIHVSCKYYDTWNTVPLGLEKSRN